MAVNNTAEVRYALQNGQKFPTNAPLVLTEPIVLTGKDGPPRIEPNVPGKRVKFSFEGAGDAPFIIQDSRSVNYQGIDVDLKVPCEAAFIFERRNVGAGVVVSTHPQLTDVRIYGNGIGRRGIWFRVPVADQNNEHSDLRGVTIYYVTEEAIRIDGAQAKEHLFHMVRVEGGKAGIVSNSGSFTMIGGALHVLSDAGVVLNNPTGAVTMIGVASETANRFLRKTSATADSQPVQLINCTMQTDQLNADKYMIDFRSAGPLVIQGGIYGDGAQPVPRINFQPLGTGLLRLQDVVFGAWGSFEDKANLTTLAGSSIFRADMCFFRRAGGQLANQEET